MNYKVYIVYSKTKDKYYIGYSSNIEERIKNHNWGHKGFTAQAKDWEIKYEEDYEDKKTAILREREIKNWKSRRLIEKLIRQK